jgi:predicted DNA-binding transcriptional regulator YafY
VDRAGWDGSAHQRPDPPHLDAVQTAVVEGRQAVLGYVAGDGTATTRTVHPLGLAVKVSVWYLVADTPAGQRTFRVDRITSVELTTDAVVRPEGFDLAQAWRSITAEVDERRSPIRARAVVAPDMLSLLRWVFGKRLRIGPPQNDRRVEVELRSASIGSLAGEIAGFGDALEVLEPDEIRQELACIAGQLAALYIAPPLHRTGRPLAPLSEGTHA